MELTFTFKHHTIEEQLQSIITMAKVLGYTINLTTRFATQTKYGPVERKSIEFVSLEKVGVLTFRLNDEKEVASITAKFSHEKARSSTGISTKGQLSILDKFVDKL